MDKGDTRMKSTIKVEIVLKGERKITKKMLCEILKDSLYLDNTKASVRIIK